MSLSVEPFVLKSFDSIFIEEDQQLETLQRQVSQAEKLSQCFAVPMNKIYEEEKSKLSQSLQERYDHNNKALYTLSSDWKGKVVEFLDSFPLLKKIARVVYSIFPFLFRIHEERKSLSDTLSSLKSQMQSVKSTVEKALKEHAEFQKILHKYVKAVDVAEEKKRLFEDLKQDVAVRNQIFSEISKYTPVESMSEVSPFMNKDQVLVAITQAKIVKGVSDEGQPFFTFSSLLKKPNEPIRKIYLQCIKRIDSKTWKMSSEGPLGKHLVKDGQINQSQLDNLMTILTGGSVRHFVLFDEKLVALENARKD